MATLQKFKLLATQCVVAGRPSTSPTASPVIHLRRRKTLRMLLTRPRGDSKGHSPDRIDSPEKKGKEMVGVSHKLKDLFVSSPPEMDATRNCDGPVGLRRGGDGGVRQLRPLSATLRQRLLRRAWRPVLIAIPEIEN